MQKKCQKGCGGLLMTVGKHTAHTYTHAHTSLNLSWWALRLLNLAHQQACHKSWGYFSILLLLFHSLSLPLSKLSLWKIGWLFGVLEKLFPNIMQAVNYCSTCRGRSARLSLTSQCEPQVYEVPQLCLLIYFYFIGLLPLSPNCNALNSEVAGMEVLKECLCPLIKCLLTPPSVH